MLHWSFCHSDQVAHPDNCSQLQVRGMDEDFSSSGNGSFYEPIGYSVELFDILFGIVMQIDVQIFKILCPVCICLARDVQNVSYTQLKHSSGFET